MRTARAATVASALMSSWGRVRAEPRGHDPRAHDGGDQRRRADPLGGCPAKHRVGRFRTCRRYAAGVFVVTEVSSRCRTSRWQVEEGADGGERLGPDGPVHPAAALSRATRPAAWSFAHVEGQRRLGNAEGVRKMTGARRPGLRLGEIASRRTQVGSARGLEDVGEHVGLGRREQLAVGSGAAGSASTGVTWMRVVDMRPTVLPHGDNRPCVFGAHSHCSVRVSFDLPGGWMGTGSRSPSPCWSATAWFSRASTSAPPVVPRLLGSRGRTCRTGRTAGGGCRPGVSRGAWRPSALPTPFAMPFSDPTLELHAFPRHELGGRAGQLRPR